MVYCPAMRIIVAAVGKLKRGPERDLAERYRERAVKSGRVLGIRSLEVIEIAESRAREASRRMLEESIEYAEQDFAERQTIEARTEAETILSATQKALTTPQAISLPDDERATIDAAVAALKESVSGSDYKLIRKRIDDLNNATMHLAELVMNSAVSTALQGRKLAEV